MCKLVISITFERLEIDFLCDNLSFQKAQIQFLKWLFRLGSLYVKQRRTHCKHIVEKTKDLFSSKKSFL